jgi:hypothetical protein
VGDDVLDRLAKAVGMADARELAAKADSRQCR